VQLPNRIGLITLACGDVERMTKLFRDLGWPETPESDEHHRTFQCTNGCVLALYPAASYEPHFGAGVGGFRGFTLAVNLGSFEEVQAVYETLTRIDGVELLGEPARRSGAAPSAGATPRGTSGTSPGPRARRWTSEAR
jgi:hypothetical protein